MNTTSEWSKRIAAGEFDDRLREVYVTEDAGAQRERLQYLLTKFEETFGVRETVLISAPGRTELSGNHTDHQRGKVLAASVNLDIVACVSLNDSDEIRLQSEGYPVMTVNVKELEKVPAEENTTVSLIRGIAAAITKRGYRVKGFDGYAISNVLGGSGLSSSAAFETLAGEILNHLFCNDGLNAVEIAQIGQYAENEYFGKPCGLMDQMACSVGNAITIDFEDKENPAVKKLDYDFSKEGYALCIIDSGADHADLTDEYAAVPQEMRAAAAFFGKEVLREVPEEEFRASIAAVRRKCGDRAVLRASHFYQENARVQKQIEALEADDFDTYLKIAKESGRSSFMYLQNVFTCKTPDQQAVSVALMAAEHLLDGRGAFRVHGGGFAGTIQAFVPKDMVQEFKKTMEAILGDGACHILQIRPYGGIVLL